jgi:small subunit ribosomal protein S17
MAEEPTNEEVEAGEEPAAADAAGTEPAGGEESGAQQARAEGPSRREQRAQARQAQASKRPQRTPEERHAERVEERRAKAQARRTQRQREREKYKAESHNRQPTPPREHEPGRQKTRQGVVVSDKADKTITVRIDVARRHRRYEKIVRTSSTLHAHDESNDAHIGDTVIVRECRPMSRTKRWRLIRIVERAR